MDNGFSGKDSEESGGGGTGGIESRHLAEAIQQLSAIPDPENDVELAKNIAIETLYMAHHPCIGYYYLLI